MSKRKRKSDSRDMDISDLLIDAILAKHTPEVEDDPPQTGDLPMETVSSTGDQTIKTAAAPEAKPSANDPADHLRRAVVHYKAGRYDDAAKEVRELLIGYPNFKEGYRLLGTIYSKCDRINEAIHAFQRYLKLDPKDPHAHENLALLYLKKGDAKLAEQEWQALLKIAPQRVDIQKNLTASTTVDKQKASPATGIEGLMLDALRCIRQQDYASAAHCFENLAKQDPDSGTIHKYLGSVYFRTNRLKDAQKALEKAMELDATDIKTYENLGLVYLAQGNYKQASEVFENIMKAHAHRNDLRAKIRYIAEISAQPVE